MRVGLSVPMLFLLSLTFVPAARADVPPPDGGPPSTASATTAAGTSGNTGSTGSGGAGGGGGASGAGGSKAEATSAAGTTGNTASTASGPAGPVSSNGVNCAMGAPSSSWDGATLFGLAAAGALSLRRRRASAARDARRSPR